MKQLILLLILSSLLLGMVGCGQTPKTEFDVLRDEWDKSIHLALTTRKNNWFEFEEKVEKMNPQIVVPFMIDKLTDKRLTKQWLTNITLIGSGQQQRVCDLAAPFIEKHVPREYDPHESPDFFFPESSPAKDRDATISAILRWWEKEGKTKFQPEEKE